MLILSIAFALGLACVFAEWLHWRRIRRVRHLAFGREGSARRWVRMVPLARSFAAACLCWGLIMLYLLDGGRVGADTAKKPTQHLLICLDVSPSMYLRDAGPEGKDSRAERASAVIKSILERLDMSHTRVSIVAFYTSAKTVVVDTFDLNVIANILDDLPLEHAFKEGQTKMYEGVREAAELAKRWPEGSATLIMLSDGDTLPDSAPPVMPKSITDALIIGVGNPYRSSQVGGHSSKQDAGSLKQLAARMNGLYHDGNSSHLPTATLARLRMTDSARAGMPTKRTLALVAAGVGGSILALVSPALAAFGIPGIVRATDRVIRDRSKIIVAGSRPGPQARSVPLSTGATS